MSKILTETESFDADVTVPEGGDARTAPSVEAPFQKLTNRTRYLYEQLSATAISAQYSIAGGVASGAVMPLTEESASDGFDMLSDTVQVPSPGRYLFVLRSVVLSDDSTTDPLLAGCRLYVGGVLKSQAAGWRPSANVLHAAYAADALILEISDPETETIQVKAHDGAAGNITTSDSRLLIIRLGD